MGVSDGEMTWVKGSGIREAWSGKGCQIYCIDVLFSNGEEIDA